MNYQDKDGGLHFLSDVDIAAGGEAVLLSHAPSAVAITDKQVAAILKSRLPTVAQLRDQVVSTIRSLRAPILVTLDGMQVSALVTGATSDATALETAKQSLRDLTNIDLSKYSTLDEMQAAVVDQARVIGSALPAPLQAAFSQVAIT